jgi:CDP-paratose 2-epimerase
VLHLAAQVAVTTSLVDPRSDFEVNALGTFNVLEAIRFNRIKAPLIYSSTNKVYGKLAETRVIERDGRYFNLDFENGVAETQPVDFVSPYGCSKGAADEYVRDYHSMYGLNTVVFRQSCIYGDRQFGCEDQGWVAWLTIAALTGRPITIYGDGKQVRDLLHVQDLIDAFDAAARKIDVAAGSVYNLGGGPGNAVSVLEVLAYLEHLLGRRLPHDCGDWRNGDQRYYVSDIGRVSHDLDWQPRIGWREGLTRLFNWVVSNQHEF